MKTELCPYCGEEFEDSISDHFIPRFEDDKGPWLCYGSPSWNSESSERAVPTQQGVKGHRVTNRTTYSKERS